MGLASIFTDVSRECTKRNFALLQSVKSDLNALPFNVGGPITLICMGKQQHVTAIASSHCGVVEIDEAFLDVAPKRIVLSVVAHECIHLRLQGIIRKAIRGRRSDIDDFFHAQIIPDWLGIKVTIGGDRDFIDSKGWCQAYEGWFGPLDIEISKATAVATAYFEWLKQGRIYSEQGEIFSLFPLRAAEELHKKIPPTASIDREYITNPHEAALKIATGYELIEYFTECHLAKLSHDYAADIATLEEAFANYVASTVSGVSLTELQKWAPQDRYKTDLAHRITSKAPPLSLAETVESSEDLFTFFRNIGLLGR